MTEVLAIPEIESRLDRATPDELGGFLVQLCALDERSNRVKGLTLLRAKAMLPHGEWLPWLKQYWPLSERQAQQYMAYARGTTPTLQAGRNHPDKINTNTKSNDLNTADLEDVSAVTVVEHVAESQNGTSSSTTITSVVLDPYGDLRSENVELHERINSANLAFIAIRKELTTALHGPQSVPALVASINRALAVGPK